MPRKDRKARLEYQREWYARPENRARTIENVAARRRDMYGGICLNCGGPTVGQSKRDIPRYCGKPACKTALWREKQAKARLKEKRTVVSLDDLLVRFR